MRQKIGIIAAMPEEMEAIRKIMKEPKEKKEKHFICYEGMIGQTRCVLAKCGVGKVNAARITQLLIDCYQVECVINVGSAGAINDEIHYGDIVIGKYVVQHDFDLTAFGHEKGYISNIGVKLESDKQLIEKAQQAIEQIVQEKYKIVIGTIATGDIFCTSIKMKEKIRKKFEADCVEMEGAAIAQVCFLDEIPFLIIRSISDSPNGKNEIDFNQYLKMASGRCAEFLQEFLK